MVAVHERCSEQHPEPFDGMTEWQWADHMAGF